MANKTSIIIKSVDDNNKETSRSITDVSKTATNQQLKAFAQAINATSTNTYLSSSRVQTTDLDTTEPTKQSRNIRIVNDSEQTVQASFSDANAGQYFSVRYDGTGLPYVKYGQGTWFDAQTSAESVSTSGGSYNWFIMFANSEPIKASSTIKVCVDEDATFAGAELEITLTGGQ